MSTMSLRATSFGASALVMGFLGFAALTMSTHIGLHALPTIDPPSIDIAPRPIEPPPPEPPKPVVRQQNPIPALADDAQRIAAIDDGGATQTIADVATDTGPLEITQPHWTRHPDNLARYYPERAVARSIEGAVTLDCIVRVSGALDCAVVSETPRGWGFAEAALRISRDYAMVPATRDGAPVEGRYRMRVPFALH